LIGWGIKLLASVFAEKRLVVEVSGLESLPRRGPLVVAARHYHNFYDGLALLVSIPRRCHIVVALDWVGGRPGRVFMETITRAARWPVFLRPDALRPGADGSAPQKKSAYVAGEIGRYRRKALRGSVRLLREGSALIVFPEGYPNIDPHHTPKTAPEEFRPFRAGFAAIVASVEKSRGEKIPVVPVGISYVPGERWTARLSFGAPMYLGSFPSREAFVHAVQARVQELSRG
jgi:1-acyl-sn-glycerol-3-phosphate acyltransferase